MGRLFIAMYSWAAGRIGINSKIISISLEADGVGHAIAGILTTSDCPREIVYPQFNGEFKEKVLKKLGMKDKEGLKLVLIELTDPRGYGVTDEFYSDLEVGGMDDAEADFYIEYTSLGLKALKLSEEPEYEHILPEEKKHYLLVAFERFLKRAIEINPNEPISHELLAHTYAFMLKEYIKPLQHMLSQKAIDRKYAEFLFQARKLIGLMEKEFALVDRLSEKRITTSQAYKKLLEEVRAYSAKSREMLARSKQLAEDPIITEFLKKHSMVE